MSRVQGIGGGGREEWEEERGRKREEPTIVIAMYMDLLEANSVISSLSLHVAGWLIQDLGRCR